MTNLEILEKAVECTGTMYYNRYSHLVQSGSLTSQMLQNEGAKYSGDVLFKVLNSTLGVYSAYTRQGDLRKNMESLSYDSIKTELLKNAVNVATYHKITDTIAGNRIGDAFSSNLSDDEIAVILFNNLLNHGVERGFELLNDPTILASVCRTFAYYKGSNKKEELSVITRYDPTAQYINDEIDVYYARYCDRRNDNGQYGGK